MPAFDLAGFLPYQLATAAAQVSRAFAERYRADFGLTIPEWRVLAHLAAAEAVSVREIQARVDLDKSVVSRAVARLTKAGLAAKDDHPTDGRLLDIRLTDEGRALFARIVPVAEAYQADLLARLGTEAAPFRRGLQRLRGDA